MTKKKKDDKENRIYDYKNDTYSLLSSMIDPTFGPRMYQEVMKDVNADFVERYKPQGWSTVEDIKNLRAGFMVGASGTPILRITYHNIAVMDNGGPISEKYIEDGAALIDKVIPKLKKKFKELSNGKTLHLKELKMGRTKAAHIEVELMNNPRVETSWINGVIGKQMPRTHYKVSKFYEFTSVDSGDTEKYKDIE